MALIVANRKGETDGVAAAFLGRIQSDIPIVLISRARTFRFNEELENLKGKKWVLCDYIEYGWNYHWNYGHHWGINTKEYDFLQGEHWERFDSFVKENPPALTFKRELLKSDVSGVMKPIDYPAWYESKEIQTREQFDGRPISSFFFWGRSHEARVKLHAEIWRKSSEKGYSVCDNINYFEKFVFEEEERKWVTMNIPHYSRIDIKEILGRQQLSKTSIALPGAGIKTFRHCESPVNSVMVKYKDNLAWAYEWDETNCILTKEGREIEDIEAALQNPNLYEIYLNGVATCHKYHFTNYINNYINPILNSI